MTEGIIIALITGGLSLMGVIISNRSTANKMMHTMNTSQAVMDTKLDELTREVREHNHFAQKVPALELRMGQAESNIKELQTFHKRQ